MYYKLPDLKLWATGSSFLSRSRFTTFLIACLLSSTLSFAQGTWNVLSHTAPHSNAGVMLLLTDGRVMVKSGSGGGNGTIWDILTPDASGSYHNGTWTSTAPMANDRLYFSSQVLRDGRVYVCGGEYGAGGSDGEVYDPQTDTWTPCPSVGFFVSDANSEILPDGRVLQAFVGSGTRHNRLWDPATNTYSAGPDCLRTDNEASWLKLPDNSILFIDNYSTSSERYIPASNTWINDGTVPVNVYDPFGDEAGGAHLLPDGRGFFIGSSGHNALYTPSGSTAPGTWAAAPDLPGPSGTPDAASATMIDGKILIAASDLPTSTNHFPTGTRFYEYDYITNSFTSVTAPGGGTSLSIPCYYTNMLDLPDGTVLYGQQGSTNYHQYTPGSAALPAGKPTANAIFRLDCDTFLATGTLFNGISEGASYGDDWQMESNYPIIRLSAGSSVYYALTTNWNSTGLQRGSAPDTTKFVLPVGLPPANYMLEVVANGNPSAPFSINTGLAISPASTSFCQGATTTLTDVWLGGTWSSANTSIATVDPVTGVVTGVAAGSTTISYFIGSCFATATVTINPTPSAIIPAGGTNLCLGATTTFSSSPSTGTWTSSASSVASVGSVTGIVSGVSLGSATISYSVSGCFVVETVTVNAAPLATITPLSSTAICPGGSVILNANSGTGYSYQWNNSGVPISGATNISYTATATGSLTVRVTTPVGCSATSSVTNVTLAAGPPATITVTGSTTVCAGNTVTLTANTGVGLTYQWLSGGSAVAGATSLTYAATTTGTYSVRVTNSAGCFTTSSTVGITVNPAPSAITGTFTLCSGSTTTLSNTTTGGTWTSSAPGIASIGSSSGIVTGLGSGGIATISYTLPTGCRTTAPVTVNAASAAPITGSSLVCVGQTITLNCVTPSGTWTSSAPSFASVSATGVVTGVASGSATISYSVATSCGSAIVTKAVSISIPPVVAPITGTLTICSGSVTMLSDATPSGVWSSSTPSIATISTAGLATGVTPGVDTIKYSVTNTAGCTTSAIVIFNVFSSLTTTVTASGATSFCTGGYVNLTALTGTGYTYQWKRNGIIITGATASAYTANSNGDYSVSVTLPGGCNATSAPTTVVVNPLPIITPSVGISASAGPVFCNTTSPATFFAMPVNGGTSPTYNWLVNGTSVGSGSSFGYTPAAGDIVTCSMTSNASCAFPATVSRNDTVSISPLQTPSVTVTASPAVICAGKLITFTANPIYGGTSPTYGWTKNGTSVATGPSYVYVPASGDVLKATLYSSFQCRAIDSAVSSPLSVFPQAVTPNTVSVAVTQSSIVAGSIDTFVAIAPNGGTAPQYQWLLNGAPVAGATNSIYVTSTLAAGDVVSCKVTSNKPCVTPTVVTSGGIKVTVHPVGIQHINTNGNSFTLAPNPNNGTFTIEGTLVNNTNGRVEIVVTNMLGQTVYSQAADIANGILNHEIQLDGKAASGIYLVKINFGTESVVYRIVVEK